MKEYPAGIESLGTTVVQMGQKIIGYFPNILAALAILITGWLLATLVRSLCFRLQKGFDQVWYRIVLRTGLPDVGVRELPLHIIGEVLFWIVILFFLTSATEVLGLNVFTIWLSKVVDYLPTIISAGLIILSGFLISGLVKDLVSAGSISAGLSYGGFLGRVSQGIVLAAVLVIGAEQIGLDVTFLVTIIGIVLGTMLGGVALAFGIGAGSFVGNVISAREVRRIYQIGDMVRVGETKGKIVEITTTSVILEFKNSKFAVPAKVFNDQISVLLEPGPDDGTS